MADKKRARPDKKKAPRAKGMETFQEAAKRFKPGPVAPPESEANRPDMSGAQRTTPTGALVKQVIDDPARGRMSDGKPGRLTKMPERKAET
jgi:hypothetical protein